MKNKGNLEFISTRTMSRTEWLQERKKAIGGSDAAAIVGLNSYASPYTVWADKTGRLPEKPDSEAMRQGRDLEQYVADRFAELTGKKTRRFNAIIKNRRYPWASANIDREVFGESAGLECKTTSVLNLGRFKDGEFPENYYVQCVHYLAVTEKTRWYLAVLVLNQGFLVYQITRVENDPMPEWCSGSVFVSDDEMMALMAAEKDFWELVKKDTPPETTGSKADTKAIGAVYRFSDPTAGPVNLVGREDMIRRIMALKAQEKGIEEEMERCIQTLKMDLGNCETGQTSGHIITWKTYAKTNFDRESFQQDNPDIDLRDYFYKTPYRKFEIKPIQ